jgi:hypothetical protein
MKKALYAIGVCVLLAGFARGQGTQVVLQDDFNDGSPNTVLWKARQINDGLFTERNGSLCFSCPSGYGMARWTGKSSVTLLAGDTLSFEALVSAGSRISTDSTHLVELGLGFTDTVRNPSKSCVVYLARTPTGLSGFVECTAGVSRYKSFVIPGAYSRHIISLHYSTNTGKVTVSYRPMGTSWGIVIATIPLNRWWGIPAGESAPLTPLLTAQAYGIPVQFANKAFLDEAVMTITAP